MHLEDGQGQTRWHPAVVSPAGCGGLQLGPHRDHDDQDGEQGCRSWKDALLGRAHGRREYQAKHGTATPLQQRSTTPTSRRRHKGSHRKLHARCSSLKATPPLSLLSGNTSIPMVQVSRATTKGPASPVSTFFPSAEHVPLALPPHIDCTNMQQIDKAIADALASPLEFPAGTIADACRTYPSAVSTAVHHASVLLVKQLGLLGPKESMSAKAAEALIKRFDEPLSDDDIAIIAKLTRLNLEALCIAGVMVGPDVAADVVF
ncbi:Cytochrome P450 71D8 [Hordeum vulgare]|nr:Cytochrome P450 71D8 [Hordeum vulgare]